LIFFITGLIGKTAAGRLMKLVQGFVAAGRLVNVPALAGTAASHREPAD
jgi:hypothetical protein